MPIWSQRMTLGRQIWHGVTFCIQGFSGRDEGERWIWELCSGHPLQQPAGSSTQGMCWNGTLCLLLPSFGESTEGKGVHEVTLLLVTQEYKEEKNWA